MPRSRFAVPDFKRLGGKDGGNRVGKRQPLAILAPEPVTAIFTLEAHQLRRFPLGTRTVQRDHPDVMGVKPDAEQLGKHIRTGELRSEVAKAASEGIDALRE